MKELMILQTVAPDYRKSFFDILHNNFKEKFALYAGSNYFESSVKTDVNISYVGDTKNFYFFNRRFLFQFGMWHDALTAKNLVLELNPRILSNWVLLFFRKILRKKTILWGHAWPTNGQNSITDLVRNIMRELSDIIIVYTSRQAKELRKKMLGKRVICAPNALYTKHKMNCSDLEEIYNIIYVGRLTPKKKPLILLKAFQNILNDLPKKAKLFILGEGPEKKDLINFVDKFQLNNRVKILGHIGNYTELYNYYQYALFSVSPGYVGLSITQSFGFGVPMLISKYEKHSPEIEVAETEFNSMFFETDYQDDLEKKILSFYANKDRWIRNRKIISQKCREKYSVESMARVFIKLV